MFIGPGNGEKNWRTWHMPVVHKPYLKVTGYERLRI
jgi:hypothetical protein